MATEIIGQLQEAFEKLETAEGDLIVDLSPLERIDASVLGELERLAAAAEAKSVSVAVRGVNVDVYKVLKLMKLAPRFTFLA